MLKRGSPTTKLDQGEEEENGRLLNGGGGSWGSLLKKLKHSLPSPSSSSSSTPISSSSTLSEELLNLLEEYFEVDKLKRWVKEEEEESGGKVAGREEVDNVKGGRVIGKRNNITTTSINNKFNLKLKLTGKRATQFKKTIPIIGQNLKEIVVIVTKFLLNGKGSKEKEVVIVEGWVKLARLSLLSLYGLESELKLEPMTVELISSNLVIGLVQVKQFRAALTELLTLYHRVYQYLEPYTTTFLPLPPTKRSKLTLPNLNYSHSTSDVKLDLELDPRLQCLSLGFPIIAFYHLPLTLLSTVLRLCSCIQVNLLRCYIELEDFHKLKSLANLPPNTPGSPLHFAQPHTWSPPLPIITISNGSSNSSNLPFFYELYSIAATRLIERAGSYSDALRLFPTALTFYTLCPTFSYSDSGNRIRYLIKSCKDRLKSPPPSFHNDLRQFYESIFEILMNGGVPPEGDSTIPYCHLTSHYLELMVSPSNSHNQEEVMVAYRKVVEFSNVITDKIKATSSGEKDFIDWVHALYLAGFLEVTTNEDFIRSLITDTQSSTRNLLVHLRPGGIPDSNLERICSNLRIVAKGWSPTSPSSTKPYNPSDSTLGHYRQLVLESVSSVVNQFLVTLSQSTPPKTSLLNLIELVTVLTEPLMGLPSSPLLNLITAFDPLFTITPTTMMEEQDKFIKVAFFCGAYLEKRSQFSLASSYYEIACRRQHRSLEATPHPTTRLQIQSQLAKKYFKWANCQRSEGVLESAHLTLLQAITLAPDVEVGVRWDPDTLCLDSEQERLYYVDRYVRWNLIAIQKDPTLSYLPISSHPTLTLLGSLSRAALIEKELHTLNDNPSRATHSTRVTLVDQLLTLYVPVQLHRLAHARALLLKFELILSDLHLQRITLVTTPGYQVSEGGFNRSVGTEIRIELRRILLKAQSLVPIPESTGQSESSSSSLVWQLLGRIQFHLGTVAYEFHEDGVEQHLELAIQYWSTAFQTYPPLRSDTIPPTTTTTPVTGDPEGAYQFSLRMRGLLQLLSCRHLLLPLADTMLRINILRGTSTATSDAIEVYMQLASLHQTSGEFPLASEHFHHARQLLERIPKLVLPGLVMRLGFSKYLLVTGSDSKRRSLMEKLAKLADKVTQLDAKPQACALSMAYETFATHYLYDGDIASAIDVMQQYRLLSLRATNSALLRDGVDRHRLNALSTLLFWECLCVSPHYQLIEEVLHLLKVLGQLHIATGSSREADRMFKLGSHLAKSASADGYYREFQLLEGDLSCRRHNWPKCSGLLTPTLTSLQSDPLPPSEARTKQLLFGLLAQGKMFMGQKQFPQANESFLRAAYTLERVTGASHSEPGNLEDTSFSLTLLPFIAQPKRGPYWDLQVQLLCLLSWTLVKLNRLEEARQIIDQVDESQVPPTIKYQYHLVLSKLFLFRVLHLLSRHERFSSILDAVWSLPSASRAVSVPDDHDDPRWRVTHYSEQATDLLEKAEKHLTLALQDVTQFGFSNDALEVGNYFGLAANLLQLLRLKSAVLPSPIAKLTNWATYSLESPKGLSYRRELLGLLATKSGNSVLVNKWPQFPPRPKLGKRPGDLWGQILKGYDTVHHGTPEKFLSSLTELLPPNWAVCSLTFNPETEEIYVTRTQVDSESPVLLRLPTRRHAPPEGEADPEAEQDFSFSVAYQQLNTIIQTNVTVTGKGAECDTNEKKEKWWRTRYALDLQLQNLLEYMESGWLGGLKGILAPDEYLISDTLLEEFHDSLVTILSQRLPQQVASFTFDRQLLRVALRGGSRITTQNIEDWILFLLDSLDLIDISWSIETFDLESATTEVYRLWQSTLSQARSVEEVHSEDSIDHIILILDKHTQFFPWENLPLLRGRSISRLPSFHCLRDCLIRLHHHQSHHPTASPGLFGPQGHRVNQDKAFYVLNPEKDLVSTQHRLQDQLLSYSPWDGVIGQPPTSFQLATALTDCDLYLYFGHGSGGRYLPSPQLKALPHCSVALLFGCSSGALLPDGEFDPTGEVMNYLMAGCPTILANLWDVTDKDLDRFTIEVFQTWPLNAFTTPSPSPSTMDTDLIDRSPSSSSRSLTTVVAKSRDVCKLPYLVGAAPVVYGIPCYLQTLT